MPRLTHLLCEMGLLTCESLREELQKFAEETFTIELSQFVAKVREEVKQELQHFLEELCTSTDRGTGKRMLGSVRTDDKDNKLRASQTSHVSRNHGSGVGEGSTAEGGRAERKPAGSSPLAVAVAAPLAIADPPGIPTMQAAATECACGNIFMADAEFCRKCGKKRAGATPRKNITAISPTRFLVSRRGSTERAPPSCRRKSTMDIDTIKIAAETKGQEEHKFREAAGVGEAGNADQQRQGSPSKQMESSDAKTRKQVQLMLAESGNEAGPTLHAPPEPMHLAPEPVSPDHFSILPMQVPREVCFSNIDGHASLEKQSSKADKRPHRYLEDQATRTEYDEYSPDTKTASAISEADGRSRKPNGTKSSLDSDLGSRNTRWSDRITFIGNRHLNKNEKNGMARANKSTSFGHIKSRSGEWWPFPTAKRVVRSSVFEYGIISCIVLNALTIGIQTDIMARDKLQEPPSEFNVFETIFAIVFTVELVIRIYVYRCRFFFSTGWKWNFFDLSVVMMQWLEKVLEVINLVLQNDTATGGGGNFSFMRVMRILRLIRVLRIVRLLRLITELKTIVDSLIGSLRSLLWTLALLLLLIYIIGIYFTQLVSDHMVQTEVFGDEEVLFDQYYGSLARSILSLFQAMSGGIDWDNLAQPLVERISPLLGLVLALYIAFALLALMNVVTGVFVESALKNARDEQEHFMVQHARRLFQNSDLDCSGKLNWEEFQCQMSNPEMQQYFRLIDVEIQEATELFKLLDLDRSGEVDYEEFLNGCLRLRGNAKAIDLVTLLLENRRLFHDWSCHANLVETELFDIGESLQRSEEHSNAYCQVTGLAPKLEPGSLSSLDTAASRTNGTTAIATSLPQLAENSDGLE